MNDLADQGDAGEGPLAGPPARTLWAPPRVIVSVSAAEAEAKSASPLQEGNVVASPTYTPS